MKPVNSPDFRDLIGNIAIKRGTKVSVFGDFCRMGACCLAMGTREKEYLEVAARYDAAELKLFSQALAGLVLEMERKPFDDVLGPFYLEVASKATQDARGEFYTPGSISKMIARMLFDSDDFKQQNRPITICEPACGAGGMILAIGELMAPNHVDLLRVTSWDLNPIAADMCYLNTTMWGIPAQIVWGDTLRHQVHRSWKNIHWFRVGEDVRRLLAASSAPSDIPPESDLVIEPKLVEQLVLF